MLCTAVDGVHLRRSKWAHKTVRRHFVSDTKARTDFSDGAFDATGPRRWNNLPPDLRQSVRIGPIHTVAR